MNIIIGSITVDARLNGAASSPVARLMQERLILPAKQKRGLQLTNTERGFVFDVVGSLHCVRRR